MRASANGMVATLLVSNPRHLQMLNIKSLESVKLLVLRLFAALRPFFPIGSNKFRACFLTAFRHEYKVPRGAKTLHDKSLGCKFCYASLLNECFEWRQAGGSWQL